MQEGMKAALAEYGRAILERGWQAGEPIIVRSEERYKGFRQWATALGIMLRAEELLNASRSPGPSRPGGRSRR